MNILRTPKGMVWAFMGGLLLFAAVGLIRGALEANRAMVSRSVQNSVAVAAPAAPTAVPTAWLKIQVAAGARWVYADQWYSCTYMRNGEYTVGDGYDVAGWPNADQWRALPVGIRQEIERICHE